MKLLSFGHTRIFIQFFLGIVLPCVLLGYFAFRGIKNDQALMEKEARWELRQTIDKIIVDVHEVLAETKKSFLESIGNAGRESRSIAGTIEAYKEQHPLVEEVFIVDRTDVIQMPAARLLYCLEGKIASTTPPPVANGLTLEAQRSEYQSRDYSKALRIYSRALGQATDDQQRGQILNAIARVQKKLDQTEGALQSYQQLIESYSQTTLGSGFPLGLAAQYEIGSLQLARKDSLKAIETWLDLMRRLLNGHWTLPKAQYEFYFDRTNQALDDVFSTIHPSPIVSAHHRMLDSLTTEEKICRERTSRLLLFQDKASSLALSARGMVEQDLTEKITDFPLEIGGQAYLVSLAAPPPSGFKDEIKMVGLLFNAEHLRTNVIPAIVADRIGSGKISWNMKDHYGNVILETAHRPNRLISTVERFVGNVPPWTIEFQQQNPNFVNALFFSKRGIYFYIFIFVTFILGFGMYLTIHSLARELELAKMKSSFVTSITHDLKSPLTSIRHLATMLQAGRVPSEERRRRYHDVLVEQSDRLTLLIDNILDSARMEGGKLEHSFGVVDIKKLVEQTISEIQRRVQSDGFTIRTDFADNVPELVVDRGRIVQAITNLVDNAMKFSDSARVVDVKLRREDKHVAIVVTDHGVGINRAEIQHVFERFYRGDGEKTIHTKGSGLGLTLVQQIVEAHGGSVHVESEPGKGSVFTVRLPIDPREKD